MFYSGFQNLNTNFFSGFSPFAFPQFSFAQTPWSFNNCNFFSNYNLQMPIFDFNTLWKGNNTSSFNNIWDITTPLQTKNNDTTNSTNTDMFVLTTNNSYAVSKEKSEKSVLDDYNAIAGNRLAEIALQGRQFNSWSKVPDGMGRCAHFVSNALDRAGLSNGMRGHAYMMIDILKQNPHFKEIPADSIDVDNLPAGCILGYERGSQGYSEDYGHLEITTGDGEAVSQAITYNLKDPDAVFIPV